MSQPLICPPQSIPPADSDPGTLFSKAWWLYFHNLGRAVAKLVSAGGGGGVSGGIVLFEKTLTADSGSIDISTAPIGGLFMVIVHENATGGWQQTWQAAFVGMAGFVQTTTPSTYTAALFHTPDGSAFRLISPPVTGVH